MTLRGVRRIDDLHLAPSGDTTGVYDYYSLASVDHVKVNGGDYASMRTSRPLQRRTEPVAT